MTVDFPAFLASSAPSRIASKIRVLLTAALTAASSGLRPARGMARPVTLGCIEFMAHHCVSRHRAARNRIRQRERGVIPRLFENYWKRALVVVEIANCCAFKRRIEPAAYLL